VVPAIFWLACAVSTYVDASTWLLLRLTDNALLILLVMILIIAAWVRIGPRLRVIMPATIKEMVARPILLSLPVLCPYLTPTVLSPSISA
jgi:hypothetical protein